MHFSKRRQITSDPRWNAQRFNPSSTIYYLICGEEEDEKNPYKLVLLLIDFRSDSFGNVRASWQQQQQLLLQLWALSAEQVTLIFLGDSERAATVAGAEPGLVLLRRETGRKLSVFNLAFSSCPNPKAKWFLNLRSGCRRCKWSRVRSNSPFELPFHLASDQCELANSTCTSAKRFNLCWLFAYSLCLSPEVGSNIVINHTYWQ